MKSVVVYILLVAFFQAVRQTITDFQGHGALDSIILLSTVAFVGICFILVWMFLWLSTKSQYLKR